jgi:hypothetical protein
MKHVSIVIVFGILFLVAGCDEIPQDVLDQYESNQNPNVTDESSGSGDGINKAADSDASLVLQSCTMNSECSDGNVCIDNICGKLADLYSNEDCDAMCRITEVHVVTNRGDSYNFPPGKGSYTGAGALEWRLQSGPNHCAIQDPRVPIIITKRNYGDVISEAYVTLAEGETTSVLDHPSVPLEFTLSANKITTTCT